MAVKENSKERFEKLAENPAELSRAILESQGFVLERMKKAGVMPSADALIETQSPWAAGFLMENHKLTEAQKKKASLWFQDLNRAPAALSEMDSKEIKAALREGAPVGPKALLRKEDLANVAAIERQEKLGNSHFGRVLARSAQALSLDDFLSLPKEFLKPRIELFHERSGDFADARFKKLWLSLVEKENRGRIHWRALRGVPMGKEDLEMLWETFALDGKGWGAAEYENIAEIPGAQALISKEEFFLRANPREIKSWDLAEIREKKALIQNVWLKEASKDHWFRMSAITNNYCSYDQFEVLMDEGFAEKIIKKAPRLEESGMGRDDQETQKKEILLRQMLARVCAKNKALREKVGGYEMGRLMSALCSARNHGPEKEALEQTAKELFIAALPELMKSAHPGFGDMMGSSARNYWMGEAILRSGMIQEVCEAHPSANLLFFVLSGAQRIAQNGGLQGKANAQALEAAGEICSKGVGKKSIARVKEALGWKGAGLKGKAGDSGFEDDFLNPDWKKFGELPEDCAWLLAKWSPEFSRQVKTLDLPLGEGLLIRMLNGGEVSHLLLLQELSAERKEKWMGLEIFKASLLRHEAGSTILDLARGEDEELFERMSALAKEVARVEEKERQARERKKKRRGGFAGADCGAPECKRLEGLRAELQKGLGVLPYGFLAQKGSALLDKEDWGLFGALASKVRDNAWRSMLEKKLQGMAPAQVEKALLNDDFARLLDGCVSYELKTNVKWENVGFKESCALAKSISQAFKRVKTEDDSEKPLKCLALFAENSLGFVKRYAIDELAPWIPYSMRLEPERKERLFSSTWTVFVREPYTDEELLEVWDKLEAADGWCVTDNVNARTASLFARNFSGAEKGFLGFLAKAKSRPKLYALLSDSEVWEEFTREDRQKEHNKAMDERKTMDQLKCEFVDEHFDFDVLMQGVSGWLSDMEKRKDEGKGWSAKLALRVVQGVIWASRWDEEKNGVRKWKSSWSHEKSLALARLLLAQGPLMLLNSHAVGCLRMNEEFERNFGELAQGVENPVDRVILPMMAQRPEYFTLDEKSSWQIESLEKMWTGMIRWLAQTGQKEELARVDWLLRQERFQEDLSYSARGKNLGFGSGPKEPCLEVLARAAKQEAIGKEMKVALERFEIEEGLGEREFKKERPRMI